MLKKNNTSVIPGVYQGRTKGNSNLQFKKKCIWLRDSPSGSDSKESACIARSSGSVPGLGRSPGEGKGYPFQYSCLENSMDRGAWWATVRGITKSWTWTEWLTHTLLRVDLQSCVNFYCTAEWFSYTYTYILFSCPFPLWSIIGYETEFPVLHSRALLFDFLLYGSTTTTSCLFFSLCCNYLDSEKETQSWIGTM